jgi:phthiocerol/phenolphthiocerol synthesis type-I polyketide synthase E
MSDFDQTSLEGVAIVGMALRVPGARTVQEFWSNLCAGVESRVELSPADLAAAGMSPAALDDPRYVNAAFPIEDDDVERFDAAFFGINPREAEVMDPQHRMFLQCAWEALEDAGHDPGQFRQAVGVFGGVFLSTYLHRNLLSNTELLRDQSELTIRHGNEKDYLATRTSYRLGLRGPSVALQTACSTGLVAVHFACQSLLNHECDMAIAGAVSVRSPQRTGYHWESGGILSPDGHCRVFDAKAAGTVFGHGLGVVVLRRLSDAVDDGDFVHAVLRGTAINNDGSDKVGFTAPSVSGQAAAVSEAIGISGVEPDSIGYVETHGTGTAIGDPIEIEALTQAFRARTDERGYCAIASLKSNIGHLGTASGIVGLIKAALVVQHGVIPPSLHFEEPNPKIDFASSPFYVNTRLSEWPLAGPRRAGLSSFGMGGTNAHAVLEEAPQVDRDEAARPLQLVSLSARTAPALEEQTSRLLARLKDEPGLDAADVAFTLHTGRKPLPHRRMLVCRDVADAVQVLETQDAKRLLTGARPAPEHRPVAFLFPGQGAQYVGMGRGLYESEAEFRDSLDRCFEVLDDRCGLDLRSVLFADDGDAAAAEKLTATSYAQPALFSVSWATARLWMSWGIQPQVMMGHSIGEYVAACLAGTLSLEDALELVAERGRLMQGLEPGSMLAVSLPEAELSPWLTGPISLAAVNGPAMCVVAGPTPSIEALERQLTQRSVVCRRLHTSHAFHSSMMDPILEPFARRLQKAGLSAPKLPWISNVTGREITTGEATDPGYWAKHLRQAVRFGDGLQRLFAEPDLVLLEVGPGRNLSTFARQHPARGEERLILSSLRHPQDQVSDVELALTSLGRLWMGGAEVDWSAVYEGQQRQRVKLPTYAFESQRFWIEGSTKVDGAVREAEGGPLWIPLWKQAPLPLADPGERRSARRVVVADALGVGAELVEELRKRGDDVTLASPDEDWSARFQSAGELPATVVDLRALGGQNGPEHRLAAFAALAKALGEALEKGMAAKPVELCVVGSGLVDVTGEEVPDPDKAVLLGPCRVVPQEQPAVRCRVVDVPEPATATARRALVERLAAEIEEHAQAPLVAWRGRHRWAQTFETLPPVRTDRPSPRLRSEGVYLLTGGLGETGLLAADWLARTLRARIVLVDKAPLTERAEWDAWLVRHGEQEPESARIRRIREMERLGAEVLVLQADLTSGEALREAGDRTVERFGALHGVFHAAGRVAGLPLALASPEALAAALSVRVRSARALEASMHGRELDLLVFLSSISSVAGGVGQMADAAVGAFLDALAHRLSAGGRPALAVDWGSLRRQDGETVAPEETAEALAQALRCPVPQVAVSALSPRALAELNAARGAQPGESGIAGSASIAAVPVRTATRHPRPSLGSSYVPPRTDLERSLAALWQDALGIDKVGIDDNFFELGGDSLLAVRLTREMKERFQVEITAATLFEGPTVRSLGEIVGASRSTEAGSRSEERGDRRRELNRMRHRAARQSRDDSPDEDTKDTQRA